MLGWPLHLYDTVTVDTWHLQKPKLYDPKGDPDGDSGLQVFHCLHSLRSCDTHYTNAKC